MDFLKSTFLLNPLFKGMEHHIEPDKTKKLEFEPHLLHEKA